MRRMSDPVALLARLIAVDTHNPGGDERQLCTLLAEELRARGGEVRLVEVPRDGAVGAYVLATWGKPRLLVNAHVDTVPVNAGWSDDPFRARVAEGRVIGLGACDTKGAIAAVLSALDAAPPRDLAIAFTGDAARTGTLLRALLERERGALADVRHAIVCEPTSVPRRAHAIAASCGSRRASAAAAGTARAPTTRRRRWVDAARLALAFADWGQRQREVGPLGFRGMCLNVAKLDGGVAFNVIPDEATVTLSVRPPPGSDVDAVRKELYALALDLNPRVQLVVPMANPSFHTRDAAAFPAALGVGAPVDLAFWTEAAPARRRRHRLRRLRPGRHRAGARARRVRAHRRSRARARHLRRHPRSARAPTMEPADVVLRFLESGRPRRESDFYLALFRAGEPERFAAISVDANVARHAAEAVTLDLRFLAALGLFPVVLLGLFESTEALEQSTRLARRLERARRAARWCSERASPTGSRGPPRPRARRPSPSSPLPSVRPSASRRCARSSRRCARAS